MGELEHLSDSANYEYFGLSPSATERDLDNAYRQLAKKMHPDKNGGTEEAKMRFQAMKERYEALKAKRSSSIGEACSREEEESIVSTPQRREAYDEDEQASKAQSNEGA